MHSLKCNTKVPHRKLQDFKKSFIACNLGKGPCNVDLNLTSKCFSEKELETLGRHMILDVNFSMITYKSGDS